MLAQAYIMEDGRRVFKSEDGTWVIDEYGEHVSNEELDYDLIDANLPSAESFLSEKQNLAELKSEREKLMEFQNKLDESRDAISGGEKSELELGELDAELSDLMPPSVVTHLSGSDPSISAPKINSAFKHGTGTSARVESAQSPDKTITPEPGN